MNKEKGMSNLALNLNNVSIHYPHFDLKNVNLKLESGSIMGLIGPNGAGKSTTIRILMGLLLPDSGDVEVLGYNMLTDADKARWDIGYASEDLRLYEKMSIGWHMQFIKDMFPKWDDTYAMDLLTKFDLKPELKIKGLSHGQRVKASLLLILARRPKLLVLDEPTTGLDPVARMETLNEMMEILRDEDRSIIFSSHNTADIEQLSDQITFIDRGHVVNSNDKESFIESWRRIRVSIPDNVNTSQLQHMVENHNNFHTDVLLTNHYSNDLMTQWKSFGIEINSIEAMTLEEIFLAEVTSSRKIVKQETVL